MPGVGRGEGGGMGGWGGGGGGGGGFRRLYVLPKLTNSSAAILSYTVSSPC